MGTQPHQYSKVGQQVTLKVFRGSQAMNVKVTLGNRPQNIAYWSGRAGARVFCRLNLRRAEDHIIDWEQVASIEGRRVRLKVRRKEVRTVRVGG